MSEVTRTRGLSRAFKVAGRTCAALSLVLLAANGETEMSTGVDGDTAVVSGIRTTGGTPAKPPPPVVRTRPMDPGECWLEHLMVNPGVGFWCTAAIGELPGCAEGERYRIPYLRSVWDAASGGWGPWTLFHDGGCVAEGDPEGGDLGAEVEREIKRLKIKPSPLGRSPHRTVSYVQMDTIVWTDAVPQTFELTLLGQEVEVEVAPVQFSWDFGDGSRALVTTKTGGPYPDKTLTHVYERVETVRIGLTTTWAGRFRPAGSQEWFPVSGVARTVTLDDPLELREYRTRLVATPLGD